MRRLFLLRHAKAEQANKDTPADSERPLTEWGRKDASLVGRAMLEKGYSPDLILCSPSKRTRETLEIARSELGAAAKIEFPDSLYAAGTREILQIVRKVPESVRQPLLIGHNPGLEECAALLAGKSGDPAAHERFGSSTEKFPTATLAVFDFEISHWKDIEPHGGALVDFVRPKELKSG
jgi:phosphohistidine phosphatase